jgi:hypothetical protein
MMSGRVSKACFCGNALTPIYNQLLPLIILDIEIQSFLRNMHPNFVFQWMRGTKKPVPQRKLSDS